MKIRLLAVALLLTPSFVYAQAATRSFEATYTATIKGLPADAQELKVWIPLPSSRPEQTISDVRIEPPYNWQRSREKEFGDEYAFATIPTPITRELVIRVHFKGTRQSVAMTNLTDVRPGKAELRRALRADKLVTISPRIQKLADEVTKGKTDRIDQAQAIYTYVVSTMKYDKTIPGWGKGDQERACDIRAGNCTDFHSLFMSLARAKDIPARFVMGFPLPEHDGTTPGYHCWAEFYVPGRGWMPVDASEASKTNDPIKKAAYFGNLGTDRVEFSMGRDLILSPRTSEPLNFFIYPRVEANGQSVGAPTLSLEVHDLPAEKTSAAAAGR